LISSAAMVFAMISNKKNGDLVGPLLFFLLMCLWVGFFLLVGWVFCFPSNAPMG
jgi:hypothetical protein